MGLCQRLCERLRHGRRGAGLAGERHALTCKRIDTAIRRLIDGIAVKHRVGSIIRHVEGSAEFIAAALVRYMNGARAVAEHIVILHSGIVAAFIALFRAEPDIALRIGKHIALLRIIPRGKQRIAVFFRVVRADHPAVQN